MAQKPPVVHSDPETLGGTPVFIGTRVPVKNLYDYLEAGDSLDEFLDDCPCDLIGHDVRAVVDIGWSSMDWLRLACGYVGVAIGPIGGNMVWLRHCHRAKKSNVDWFDRPWAHWKELTRRERRNPTEASPSNS